MNFRPQTYNGTTGGDKGLTGGASPSIICRQLSPPCLRVTVFGVMTIVPLLLSDPVAAMQVDADTLYVLTGVGTYPSDPQYRTLTYTAVNIDAELRAFLESRSDGEQSIRVMERTTDPATGSQYAHFVDPQYVDHFKVSAYNYRVSGSKNPAPAGTVITRRSAYPYKQNLTERSESCLGYAYNVSQTNLNQIVTPIPGRGCLLNPPSNGATCEFSPLHDLSFGTVQTGQLLDASWAGSVTCDNKATVTVGPISLTGEGAKGIAASLGDPSCAMLSTEYSFPMAAETKNYCINIKGQYLDPGAKLAFGVLNVTYK